MKTTPWTCLEGSTLWNAAAAQYAANGHAYHNMDHVRRMYAHAADLGIAYDADLDQAILTHDVIMDGLGDHETRSADWLDEWLQSQGKRRAIYSRHLIETTITHDINPEILLDRRLALLDLADFMDKHQRRTNTRELRDEAKRVAEINGETFDQHAWVHGTLTYLKGLHERISTGLQKLPESDTPHFWAKAARGCDERQLWTRIARGIAVTMATMPYKYAPHPAESIQRYTRVMEETLRFIAAKPGVSEGEIIRFGDEADYFPHGQPSAHDIRTLNASVVRLKDEGLVFERRIKGVVSWQASEEGLDWIERMDAPYTEWPEPGPSV